MRRAFVAAAAALGLAGLAALALLAGKTDAPAPERPLACLPPERIGAEIFVPGGSFRMGSDAHYPEEAPVRSATVAPFWMDATEVTNAQFAAFVAATGYVTRAERAAVDGESGAAVFAGPADVRDLSDIGRWWRFVPGASWRAPAGPGTSSAARPNDPVVQIAYEDAAAYAAWKGRALPTEAEWEFAARGGLDGAPFVWGAEFAPAGAPRANTWEGVFPAWDAGTDGFAAQAAPAGCYPPNGYGLYDMAGNVWEWTQDAWAGSDGAEGARTIKGGSYLCAPNFCGRYRPAARQPGDAALGASHIGFRTVRRAPTD